MANTVYVHDVLFLTFIWLVKGISVQVQLTHVKSFQAAGPIITKSIIKGILYSSIIIQ